MSKWCNTCYRNSITGIYESCNESCPIFGKTFEELVAEMVIHKSQRPDEFKKCTEACSRATRMIGQKKFNK